MSIKLNYQYSAKEERLNVISHGIGLLMSCIAFPFLFIKANGIATFWNASSLIIYGISLLVLYAASTFYHASKNPHKRRLLNIVDHAAIYVLIAGSYSPFCLLALPSDLGRAMFIFVWVFALIGVVLKLFFTGKFDKISTGIYLLMGWQIVFFIKPLSEALSETELTLLLVGGVFYSIGAILYSIKKLPYNHAIFHLFVLLGSISHFFAIYFL